MNIKEIRTKIISVPFLDPPSRGDHDNLFKQ